MKCVLLVVRRTVNLHAAKIVYSLFLSTRLVVKVLLCQPSVTMETTEICAGYTNKGDRNEKLSFASNASELLDPVSLLTLWVGKYRFMKERKQKYHLVIIPFN